MDKQGKEGGVILVVLAVAAIVLFATGTIKLGSTGGADAANPKQDGITTVTPTLNFQVADVHNPSTVLSANVWYRVNGGLPQNDADAASISIAKGSTVEYYVNS